MLQTEEAPPVAAPSSRRSARSRWALWALGCAAFISVLGACGVYNFDAPGHLSKGRFQFENGRLPRPEDMIVPKDRGFAYHDRWGFQASAWLVWRAGGWPALTAVKILVLLATFGLLWAASRPAGALACGFATLATALLMAERWDIRTEIAVYFFYAAALALVAAAEAGKRRVLVAAPLLAAVGANFHSATVVVPAILFAAAVAWCVRAGSRPRARLGFAAAGLALVAMLANPQGWRIFLVPFEYMARYRAGPAWYRGSITELSRVADGAEWMSVPLVVVWIVVPLAGLALLANVKRARAFDAALFVLGAAAALSYRRNLALGGVLLFPVLARNAHAVGLRAMVRFRAPRASGRALAAATASTMLVFAALSASDLQAVSERSSRRAGFRVNRGALPLDAAGFLSKAGFAGHAFSNWDAGATYNFARSPASLPSLNGESDHNLDVLKANDDALRDPPKHFDAFAARHRLELVFLTISSADTRELIRWLIAGDDWACVYRDEVAVAFARRAGENAALIGSLPDPPRPPEASSGGIWPWSEGARRALAVRWYRLGTLYDLWDDPARRECYDRAIRLWPGYPEAHNNLGVVLAQENRGGAEEEWREAIRLAPRYIAPRRNLARFLLNHRGAGAAREELERSLREAWDAELALDLAQVLQISGEAADLAEALRLVDRVLAERPEFPRALRLREEIRKALQKSK